MNELRRDVFQAIADPTRREIIHMLSSGSMNLNQVAEHFSVSRPAISKHVKILQECGLVEIDQQGRERHCRARLDSLNEVAAWVDQYKEFWSARLDALEKYLKQMKRKSTRKKRSR